MGRIGNRADKILMLAVGVLLGILGWSLQHNVAWVEKVSAESGERLGKAEAALHELDKRIVALESGRR